MEYLHHKMLDRPVTPVETLRRASEIGRAVRLRYVYRGNVPGQGGENMHCYNCQALFVDRYGFFVRSNRIRDGSCSNCGAAIDGVGMGPNSAAIELRPH